MSSDVDACLVWGLVTKADEVGALLAEFDFNLVVGVVKKSFSGCCWRMRFGG